MNAIFHLMMLAALPGADPAILVATPPSADVGEVRSGPVLTKTFELKHTGARGTIAIRSVETGCNCVRATIEPQSLEPGQTTKLTLSVNTLTPPEGPVSWSATVNYGHLVDSTIPTLHACDVQIVGKLLREISVVPPSIAASTTGALTQTIVVTDRRATTLQVKSALCANNAITAEVQTSAKLDGVQTQEVVVKVGDKLKPGTHEEFLILATNDTACPELRIPIRIVKRAADGISVSPETFTIRLNTNQAESSGLVQLRAGGKPIAIQNVECKQAGVSVRWSEGREPVCTIRARVNHAAAGSAGTAEAIVTFAEPAGVKQTILVNWYTP